MVTVFYSTQADAPVYKLFLHLVGRQMGPVDCVSRPETRIWVSHQGSDISNKY